MEIDNSVVDLGTPLQQTTGHGSDAEYRKLSNWGMATTIKILKIKMVRYILILGGAPHLRIGVCVCVRVRGV